MQIRVSARHSELSEGLKTYSEGKAAKLSRFYDRVHSVDVVFDVQTPHHHCELIAKADHHHTFVAKEKHTDPYAALDAVVRDVERQLTRHKERHRNRKHLGAKEASLPPGGPATPSADEGLERGELP
jgi:putative sigma-54 modulation protein